MDKNSQRASECSSGDQFRKESSPEQQQFSGSDRNPVEFSREADASLDSDLSSDKNNAFFKEFMRDQGMLSHLDDQRAREIAAMNLKDCLPYRRNLNK